MTVDAAEGKGVWALWFAGAKRERAYFGYESIVAVPPEKPKAESK
jgi:hypothetical protein